MPNHKVQVSLGQNHTGNVDTKNGLVILGYALLESKHALPSVLGQELHKCLNRDQLTAFLQRLNGYYAWVEQSDGQVRAAVDHIRSRPLFYGLANGRFYLSDDAEWVRKQVGDREMDLVAREEFQLAGYVTGPNTLFPNVKQIQAGECLIARQTETGPVVETHRYYRFLHQEPADTNEPDLRAELDRVTVRAMQRLIDYANGRQIVIPLSGGYDSRLIATMLKRLGYDNVLTFTYGVPGNKESDYSKRVADALGLRWHFVEYNEAGWRKSWQTVERREYQKWASGCNSIDHEQDWLAVKKLKEDGVVEADAIFVPGHCCVTGLIPEYVFSSNVLSLEQFSRDLAKKHFSHAPHELLNLSKNGNIYSHMRRFGPHADFFSQDEYVRHLMEYNWQERQAKYICNSVRVYEFFGYDWWLPLWDIDFMKYWERVPLDLRKGREYYIEYVRAVYSNETDSDEGHNLANAENAFIVWRILRVALDGIGVLGLARGFKKRLKAIGFKRFYNLQRQSYFLLSGYSSHVIKELERKGYSVFGAYAKLKLLELEKEL